MLCEGVVKFFSTHKILFSAACLCAAHPSLTMIIYRKSLMGLALLWNCNGSALPRALIPAIFSSAVAVFFELYVSDVLLEALISHPYPFQAPPPPAHHRSRTLQQNRSLTRNRSFATSPRLRSSFAPIPLTRGTGRLGWPARRWPPSGATRRPWRSYLTTASLKRTRARRATRPRHFPAHHQTPQTTAPSRA